MKAVLAFKIPAFKVLLVLAAPGAVSAQELDLATPLAFTVRPSGFEAGPAGPRGETLDEKLARRERSFRFICVGCVRVAGRVADAPFRPIETLNAPQLTAALAASASQEPGGAPEPRDDLPE